MTRSNNMDDDVIEDGGRVRVPLMLMDASDRATASRPGYRLHALQDGRLRDPRAAALGDYQRRISDAWKPNARDSAWTASSGLNAGKGGHSIDPGEGEDPRDDAREALKKYLQEAWQWRINHL